MTDDTERALLAGVLAAPDDDNPRLVLADWWEEHGQPERGEFVRVQCELAGTPILTEVRHDALRRRERELWHQLPTCQTFAPFASGISTGRERTRFWLGSRAGPLCEVRRGFVEAITCSLATLFGEACRACADPRPDCPRCHGTGRTPGIAAALFGSQPVRQVTLTDAVIHPSGGNMTYYVGGTGQFPRKYWRSLDNLPSRKAALSALSAAVVSWGRELAGLPALEALVTPAPSPPQL